MTCHPTYAAAGATQNFKAVVVGGSAGAMDALLLLLEVLPADYPLPLLVVIHLHASDGGRFAAHLVASQAIAVSEAADKEAITAPHIYVAPADYHLLVERGASLSLSIDAKVNWARPSIDVLFESAARAWGDEVVCVVLSGANQDGADGARLVKHLGGLVIAQDPATAPHPTMPRAAIEQAGAALVLSPTEIGRALVRIARGESWTGEAGAGSERRRNA